MKKLFLIVAILSIVCLFLVGCSPTVDQNNAKQTSVSSYDTGKNVAFVEGKSVDDMIKNLQSWIDNNPTKEIITMTSDSTGGYGGSYGILIVYKLKDK